MTDIDKKIAEIEELRAKATPGLWEVPQDEDTAVYDMDIFAGVTWLFQPRNATANDVALIVATHNYLPELIVEYTSANARAKQLQAERDEAMRHLPEECPLDCGFERPGWCDLQVESIEYGDCGCSVGTLPCWTKFIAQEAAKRGAGGDA